MRAKVRLALNGGLLNLPKGLPFELRWEEEEVRGVLRLQNPVLGEVALPFASRLEGTRLLALDLPPPSLRVEGLVRPGRDELELDLELVLPKGAAGGSGPSPGSWNSSSIKVWSAPFPRWPPLRYSAS